MINLSYGQIPSRFLDSDRVRKTIVDFIRAVDFTGYSTPGGGSEIRDAMRAAFIRDHDRFDCCTSISTNLSLSVCLDLFCRSGEVILPSPTFMNYQMQLQFDQEYKIDYVALDRLIAGAFPNSDVAAGAVCILVLPNNPTGEVIGPDVLTRLLEYFNEKDVTAVIDLSWFHSIYEDIGLDLADIISLALKFDAICLLGFSKLYSLAGFRCSGVVAERTRIEPFIQRHDQLAVACGKIDEHVTATLIRNPDLFDWAGLNAHLKSQVERTVGFLSSFTDLEIDIRVPAAGIFMFFYVAGLASAREICESSKQEGLLLYPSSLFEMRDDGFRVCIAGEGSELEKGLSILIAQIRNSMRRTGNPDLS